MVLVDSLTRRSVGRGFGGAAAHSSSLLARWTRLVLRFRWLVVAVWLAALAGGVAAALVLPARLANSLSVPGTESQRAETVLADAFGERPEGTFTVVFPVPHSSDAHVRAALHVRLERAARVLPGGRLATFRAGGGVVYGELATRLTLQQAKAYTERLRRAAGPDALVTGQAAIQHDLDPQLASDLRRAEAFAMPLALLALVGLLGLSLALAVPFLFAACTIGATLAALYGVTYLVSVPSYATNVVGLIGLGLAVDYSLLMVCRYRETRGEDVPREQAVAQTMATAGRAVVYSGGAVAVGLALLLLIPCRSSACWASPGCSSRSSRSSRP